MSLPVPPASDFRLLFESAPDLLVVLDVSDEYRFVAASDAYLRSVKATRESIIGCAVFVVFPDNPDDPATASHRALRAALGRVRESGVAETLPTYQYDLRREESADSGIEERHWRTSVTPVFAASERTPGQRPVYLLLRTEAMTRQVLSDQIIDDTRSRLEATLGAAEIGTWIWEVEADRVVADRNLAAMFGVKADEAAGASLETYTRHIHEEDLPRVQAGIEEAAREGRRFEMEYRILQPDGSLRWVVARGWAERDDANQSTRFPGVLIDITERKRAQMALRASDERLRMAIDQTGLGTFDYDPRADVLEWSEGCRRIFGAAPGEVVSYQTTFIGALHPDDRERTMAALAEALRPSGPGSYGIEYRVAARDGEPERWVAARGKTTFDEAGQPEHFLGTVLDITARKRSEEAALLRSEQLQKLVEISARLNAANDLASVLGIVTEEARVLIGAQQAVTSVAAASESGRLITYVSQADKGRAEALTPPANTTGLVEDIHAPVRITRAEAESHPVLSAGGESGPAGGWLAAPLVGRNTRRLGVIQLLDKPADDFSEDDEALLAQLAQIASVAIENARLYDELRRKDQRKDEFLAMLAHELRNPLAAIRNAVALGSDPTDASETEWSMEVINRQMRKLSQLIDDLLDVSRITQGKVELRREPIDASTVLTSAVEAVRPLMEERQHELTVALRPGTLQLDADPTRLEQIVVNLLANAAKYTEKGGEIALRARKEGEQIVISVRDNGAGIPPEKLPQMFELFAQGDRTLARSEGGLGIGLTLVRSLAEMHGGSVDAFSEGPGKGSEFIVRLPASSGAASSLAGPAPDVVHPAERVAVGAAIARDGGPVRRVLVVDDNVDSARGMALILSHIGHHVRLAYDGPAAVTAAEEHLPEFVLLDIGLPGMDGYEVARRLRQIPDLADVTLIAVSGYGQEGDRRRSHEAGFDQHLIKPVDPEELLALLR